MRKFSFKRLWDTFIQEEKGSILPFVAILIPIVFFGFAALSVDIGMLYAEKTQMQTAADAAALAGAKEMALGLKENRAVPLDEAEKIARKYAELNEADKVVDVSLGEEEGQTYIQVITEATVPMAFSATFSDKTRTVQSTAKASYDYIVGGESGGFGVGRVFPFAISINVLPKNSQGGYIFQPEGLPQSSEIIESSWGIPENILKNKNDLNNITHILQNKDFGISEFKDVIKGNELQLQHNKNTYGRVFSGGYFKNGIQNMKKNSGEELAIKTSLTGLIPVLNPLSNKSGNNRGFEILFFAEYRIEDFTWHYENGKWNGLDSMKKSVFDDNIYLTQQVKDNHSEGTARFSYPANIPGNSILGQFTGRKVDLNGNDIGGSGGEEELNIQLIE